MKLTPKQELFCQYYFTPGSETLGNGVQSAKKAGYKGNDKVLGVIASENLTKPCIIARKAAFQEKTEKKLLWNYEKAIEALQLAESMAIAQGNVAGLVAAIKEKNCITGLQQMTSVIKQDKPEISEEELKDLRELASRHNLKLAGSSTYSLIAGELKEKVG